MADQKTDEETPNPSRENEEESDKVNERSSRNNLVAQETRSDGSTALVPSQVTTFVHGHVLYVSSMSRYWTPVLHNHPPRVLPPRDMGIRVSDSVEVWAWPD